MIGLLCPEKKYDDMLGRFDTLPECDRQTDNGQTDKKTELLYQLLSFAIKSVNRGGLAGSV